MVSWGKIANMTVVMNATVSYCTCLQMGLPPNISSISLLTVELVTCPPASVSELPLRRAQKFGLPLMREKGQVSIQKNDMGKLTQAMTSSVTTNKRI